MSDPAETIPAFIATCCETNVRFSESVRALGRTWQRWLLLHRTPTAARRRSGERWLVAQLTGQRGFTRVERNGRVFVKGLALRESRFALPLPDPAHTTVALLASTVSLPPAAQAHIPLQGATASKRPPSVEILRRFLAVCCAVSTSSADGLQQSGESRLAFRRRQPAEPLTRLGVALRAWLTQEGARPSLLRLCSAQWLRRELTHRGHSFFVGTEGVTLVTDLSLLPAWRMRWRSDSAGAMHSRERATPRVVKTVHLPGSSMKAPTVPIQEALRLLALSYLDEALLPDPSSCTPLPAILVGFHAFVSNRNFFFRRATLLKEVVLAALDARGMQVSGTRPPKVLGWRFRTPANR